MKKYLFTMACASLFALSAVAETLSDTDGGITWSLNTETGVLTIGACDTGTDPEFDPGVMKNYFYYSIPWDATLVKNVVIQEGVTNVGDGAFGGCKTLTSITLPASLKTIGMGAFQECNGLKSVVIPDKVEEIGAIAFQYCTGLTSVVVGNGVTSIGDRAFMQCSKLTSITLSNALQSIGADAFNACSSLTEVVLPAGVKSIGTSAFASCSNLTSINLPEGLTCVEISTFSHCTKLTEIDIPDGVTSIGSSAFLLCENLTKVTMPAKLKCVEEQAFYLCSKLSAVSLPEGLTEIKAEAFAYCNSLIEVTIPSSVTTIGTEAFFRCDNLLSVTIGSGVESIGNNCFNPDLKSGPAPKKMIWLCATPPAGYACAHGEINYVGSDQFADLPNQVVLPLLPETFFIADGIKYAVTDAAASTCMVIDCVYGATATEAHIRPTVNYKDYANTPLAVTAVGDYICYRHPTLLKATVDWDGPVNQQMFFECTELQHVTLGDDIAALHDEAFKGCASLDGVRLPSALLSVGKSCFEACASLSGILLPSSVTSIGDDAFKLCTSLTDVTVGDGVETIPTQAFMGCRQLATVTLGAGVKTIGEAAFGGCQAVADMAVKATVPPVCHEEALTSIKRASCRLFVPQGSIGDYDVADSWKEFVVMYEKDFEGGDLPQQALFRVQTSATAAKTNVELTDGALTLTDGGYSVASTFYGTTKAAVSYVRNYANTHWQALYVPFDIPVTDALLADFDFARINDTHQYDDDGDGTPERTTIEFFTVKSGTLSANTPYLIRAKATGEQTISLPATTLYETCESTIDCSSTGLLFTFQGIYRQRTATELAGCYAMGGGTLALAEGDEATLAPYRFYMDVTNRDGSGQASLSVSLRVVGDGDTTDMQLVPLSDADGSDHHHLYDLTGRRIVHPAEGIYIRGGKKYIQK